MVKHPGILCCALAAFLLPCRAIADENNLSSKFQALIGNTDPNHEYWSVHGQSTEVIEGYPGFSAGYSGANSLTSQAQWRNSTSATLFLGRRLWEGAEVYYDRELYEGKGLSQGLGIDGFPNGEANKTGSYSLKTNTARFFIRQVIELGGPQEQIASDQNQLAGKEDISRITITAGKFAADDIFDNNRYSHDPRTQFLNWSLWESGAWDYPANSRGYIDGAVIELNQEKWALRYGIFLEPFIANQGDLAWHGLNNAGHVAELEERYVINNNPGKVHFLLFWNRNREAYLNDVPRSADINAGLSAAREWGHNKYGFALSAEQQLSDSIGAFTRLSWNDGRTESWMFTDIDESAALGLSINGKSWRRPDDTWGVACVVNGTSSYERRFLERGGIGILAGDGKLNYSPEEIFETYYAFKITSYAVFSPDYQFVLNPAFNADRGPVNIFTLRLHLEF
jgi:high affinity Mn2+ porin